MSGLGLGMIAGAAAIDEQKRQEIRDREAQRFNWERQQKEADLSLLGDKTDSERSRLKLGRAQSEAGLEVLPGATANTIQEQRNKAFGLGTEEATQDYKRRAAVSDAKVKAATAQFDDDNLVKTLAQKSVQGELSAEDQRDSVMARLAQAFDANDSNRALSFFNSVSSASGLIPETNGKRAVNVTVTQGQDRLHSGPGYQIDFDDGTNMFLSHQTMKAARDRVNGNQKLNFMHDKGTGEVLVGNPTTGRVTVAREADLSRLKSDTSRMGPLERDVSYLMQSHGMTQDQALERLNSAKTMSRQSFVLKSIENAQAMGKKVTASDEAEFGAMYDRVQSGSRPVAPAATATPAAQAPGTQAPGTTRPANPNILRLITAPGSAQPAPAQSPEVQRPVTRQEPPRPVQAPRSEAQRPVGSPRGVQPPRPQAQGLGIAQGSPRFVRPPN